MKKSLDIGPYILVVLILSGCISHKMNVRPRLLQDNAIPKLNTESAVAIENNCDNSGDVEICSAGAHTFYGNLCEFSNVASDILKNALQREQVVLVEKEKAVKTLELSLQKAYCTWLGTAVVVLKVKAGDSLEKEFEGKKMPGGSAFENTRDFEIALHRAVEKIINDNEILDYLKNR